MDKSTGSMSRRTFLSGGIGLALARGILPPWQDLLGAFAGTGDYVEPSRGETSTWDLLAELERRIDKPRRLNNRGLFLTFDDGPLFCTGHILDLLALTGHKVTFFVIGRNLQNRALRKFAVRAVQEGHDLGNHSYTHPDFSTLSSRRAETEIRCAHTAIHEVIVEAGVDPSRQDLFFRFPYGSGGNRSNRRAIEQVLDELGYGTAWWDLDTHDWRMELGWYARSPANVIATLKRARPMDVVLLHDREKTAQCLPAMFETIGSLRLVSIPLSDLEFGPAAQTRTDNDAPEATDDELARDLLDTVWQPKKPLAP